MTWLRLSNVSKSYGRTRALSDASITIGAGEVHALMGENGAGKSTLIKILAGVERPDGANIEIDGNAAEIRLPRDAFNLGFRFIHQELNIVPQLSVAENMMLGVPSPSRWGIGVDWTELNARAMEALNRLGVEHVNPRTKIARLGQGDQMLAMIAGALAVTPNANSRLFVMDEPTAALTGVEANRLFAVIEALCGAGAAILYVSHRIDEVMRICDRVTVFRDGATVASMPVTETTKEEIILHMTGRKVANTYPKRETRIGEKVVCRARMVETAKVRGLNFSIREGEILGVAGLGDAGQSEVLRMLMGLDRVTGGTLSYASGTAVNNPTAAWRNAISYVPRERRREGLMLRQSVSRNIVLPRLGQLARRFGIASRQTERKHAGKFSTRVRLKAEGLLQSCRKLSGGNQQKVVFARALGTSPRLLLLNEPTRGVDVGAKFDIYRIVRELSAKGCAVVLTSPDLPELLGMCDRIMVMRDNRQSELVSAIELATDGLLGKIYGSGPLDSEN